LGSEAEPTPLGVAGEGEPPAIDDLKELLDGPLLVLCTGWTERHGDRSRVDAHISRSGEDVREHLLGLFWTAEMGRQRRRQLALGVRCGDPDRIQQRLVLPGVLDELARQLRLLQGSLLRHVGTLRLELLLQLERFVEVVLHLRSLRVLSSKSGQLPTRLALALAGQP